MDEEIAVEDVVTAATLDLLKAYTTNQEPLDPGCKSLHNFIKAALIQSIQNDTNKENLTKDVLHVFSRLICGGGDPEVELPRLKENLGSGGPCGKILLYGEPTFSCVECALDGTCVMCMECYNASVHHQENHNLLVNTSHGCGMCDCGDDEAWKYGSTCSIHKGQVEDNETIDEKLPQKVRNISAALFEELLNISVKSFLETGDHTGEDFEIPETLRPSEEDPIDVSDRYVTVIYNDEVHNFDEVIAQFKQLLDSTHSEASTYATTIDREGRMLIRRGSKEQCTELTAKFLNYRPAHSRINSHKEPLVTKSMPEYVFCLQNMLVDILDWLSNISRENAAFRRIICNVSFAGDSVSLVEGVMLCEVYYWKKVKCSWHNLIMSAYFNDLLFKKNIGVLFVKNYKAMFSAFLDDDKVRDFSVCIISLTVQLFTVPSLSAVLMTENSALEIIFQQFIDFYIKFVKETSGISKIQNFKQNSSMTKQRGRINHVLHDVRYFLTNIPDTMSVATEDAFLKFLHMIVQFLSYMQEMNPHLRESGNHILREKEWDQYFLLEISEIHQIMPLVARWCTATPCLFEKSVEILLKAQNENIVKCDIYSATPVNSYATLCSLVRYLGGGSSTAGWEQEHREMQDQKLFEHEPLYVSHDMFKDPVSFHVPVTRLFGLVFSAFPKFNFPSAYSLFDKYSPASVMMSSPAYLLDTALRSILLSQQIEANMWKRNGTTMENQSSCYRDHYKSIMWDKDLLAVQMLLCLCDPEDALLRIIRKYKIEAYLVLLKSEVCNYDPLIRMAEAFASLLLYTLGERYRLNVSEATEIDIIRKDAIHMLAIANFSRSKIIKSLEGNFDDFEEDITKTDEIDVILGKIANKIPVDDGVKTILKLKPEFYNEFTPFYYHYSHGQRQSAENSYYQQHVNQNTEFRPPTLPKYTSLTQKLRLYFVSPIIQRYIYVVLKRYTRAGNPILVSDLLLHQIVYIIMFGLLDETSTPEDPLPNKFSANISRADNPAYLIAESNAEPITALLNKLLAVDAKSVNELKPMIRWCLKTCDVLTHGASTSVTVETAESREPLQKKADNRKEMLRKRREKLMANFHSEQAKFLSDNAETFDNMGEGTAVEEEAMDMDETASFVVCGPNKGPIPRPESLTLTCILCKDSEKVNTGFSTMMYGCLIEKSVVLKREKHNGISREYKLSNLIGGEDLHVQSCGHPMHLKCLQSIMKLAPAIQQFLAMTGPDRRRSPLLLPKGDFSCPYCKMVANCALPVVGYDSRFIPDVTTKEFLMDVIGKLDDSTWDMGLDTSMEVDSPTNLTPPHILAAGLEPFNTDATSFIEMLRDTVINNQLNQLTEDLPVEPPSPVELEPSAKFKEDMRRFYRRVKNILNRDAVGSQSYAPYTIKMVSYSFSMLEYILRDKPLLAGLAEYQEGFFESFLRSLYKSMTICDHLYNQELTRELLYMFSPQQLDSSVAIPSILNVEVFNIFVAARFAIYTEGKSYDNALVELCVTAEIFKILLAIEPDEMMGADVGANDGDAIQAATVWGFVRKICGYSESDDPYPFPTYLAGKVKTELLPLLRKLALFLRYATSIPGCNAMKEMQSPEGEFNLLMMYLNLTSLSSLLSFDGSPKLDVINKWCHTIERERFSATIEFKKTKREAKLIDLPESFVDLLVRASQYTCPKIKFGKIQTTAICLICGTLVCFQSYCCQETIGDSNFGPCNIHAHRCSGDLGVFLTLEKCQVLFLPLRTQGMFIHGPYVDKYGESYKSAKNKALKLSPLVYKKIEMMWVKHEIRPMVARSSEGISFTRMEQIGLMY